eukprot:CAMPEP_0202729810 /NCGR_PEP_ID=MMETSP1385-20130828/186323_1 /ASSEMBLY_ACC=CAM_ASM_000861 /TAXON_ID=933848 /ORGANISM="Elphidium margaritaceum" /LENGTH=493 /DNA_ID=CAMNT_0049396081 /DNA_START=28 /DNA_END=1507 /DNA_ORIENTATION=+
MANNEFFLAPEEKLNPDLDSASDLDVVILKEIYALQQKAKQLHIASNGAQKTDHLVIFIHGYNNSEYEMNVRASGIDIRLGTSQVITTAFNWSSYASLLKYQGDQARAEKLSKHFVFYLKQLREGLHHQFSQIDIICHSMGNFILTRSILHCRDNNQLSLFSKCNIVCVAADVPFDMYQTAITAVKFQISTWTHYYNKFDKALLASKLCNKDKLRAGQTACTVQYENKIMSSHWKKQGKKELFSQLIFADVPFDMYQTAISAVKFQISTWTHYYNKFDFALSASNMCNKDKLRAGQTACTVQHEHKIMSTHWKKQGKKELFSHAYIEGIFGADDELTNDVLRRLNLLNISPPYDADQAELQEQTQHYSVLHSELYKGIDSHSGDSWWTDLSVRPVAGYGVLKLQEHKKKDSGFIGVVRAVAPWSNHNFKYRILHTFDQCLTKKEESKATWKDVYHDDDKQRMDEKFAEYLEMIEWRKKIEKGQELKIDNAATL